jgi:hypothetical protein
VWFGIAAVVALIALVGGFVVLGNGGGGGGNDVDTAAETEAVDDTVDEAVDEEEAVDDTTTTATAPETTVAPTTAPASPAPNPTPQAPRSTIIVTPGPAPAPAPPGPPPGAPVMQFSGIAGSFSCQTGTTATVTNTGGGYLSWQISGDVQLRFSPAGGALAGGQTTTIQVSATCQADAYRVGGTLTSNAGTYPFVIQVGR